MVFERFRSNDVNRASAVHDYASGKAVNVARVLHALGRPVVVLGLAGGGRGAAMLADLDRSGIGHDFALAAAETRQCVTVIDRAAGTATELVEESRAASDAELAALRGRFVALVGGARGVRVLRLAAAGDAGDVLPGMPRAGPAGRAGRDRRAGEPLLGALGPRSFIAKLNREELAATVGRSLEDDGKVVAAAREILPPGGAAVVTLGAGGAIAVGPDRAARAWRLYAPRVPTRSAVGSGNALAAGLILGIDDGQPLPQACAFGVACGAANAMTDRAGHLAAEEAKRLVGHVRVEMI